MAIVRTAHASTVEHLDRGLYDRAGRAEKYREKGGLKGQARSNCGYGPYRPPQPQQHAAFTLYSEGELIRGMGPVDRMVYTAAAIAAGDPSQRVPARDARSEQGRLGVAPNEMLSQIKRGIRQRE